MSWLELCVDADQEAAEAIAEVLARYGYKGGVAVEATPPPDTRPDEAGLPPTLSADPAFPVTLRTYLPLDEQAETYRQQVEQALWHLGRLRPVGPLRARVLHEDDWAHAWKRFYGVQRVGQRTVIVPSWLEYAPQPGDCVLHLDPGMAFGTGLHPTTRLCLALLEQHAHPGLRTLDLGTGSGVLAIAAARLGAGPVLALDNDPIAVQAAHENSTHNGVADQVTVAAGSVRAGLRMHPWIAGQTVAAADAPAALHEPQATPVPPPYDLVLANIIADALITLAADLAAVLAAGGTLITSGILADRAAAVDAALQAVGLRPQTRVDEGDWCALVHCKP